MTGILKMTERDKFGTGQEVFENIAKAQELFPICNVDMIFGFRGQTDEILHRDLETLLKLSPRQITTYPLMVTSQTKRSVKDSIAAPHDIMAGQYRMILDMLTEDYTQLSAWASGNPTMKALTSTSSTTMSIWASARELSAS